MLPGRGASTTTGKRLSILPGTGASFIWSTARCESAGEVWRSDLVKGWITGERCCKGESSNEGGASEESLDEHGDRLRDGLWRSPKVMFVVMLISVFLCTLPNVLLRDKRIYRGVVRLVPFLSRHNMEETSAINGRNTETPSPSLPWSLIHYPKSVKVLQLHASLEFAQPHKFKWRKSACAFHGIIMPTQRTPCACAAVRITWAASHLHRNSYSFNAHFSPTL